MTQVNAVREPIGRIKRVFQWGVENELIAPSVFHGQLAVTGLKAGRSEAKEPRPVPPVSPKTVEQTQRYSPCIVEAMVQLQRLTGMRSGKLCSLRACKIDRSRDVWEYRPSQHKTAHHGKERGILFGPRTQEFLLAQLEEIGEDEFVFSPARAEAAPRKQRSIEIKTPHYPSHLARNLRKK